MAEYCVELFDSSSTFGPNVKQAEIWDARNLGWSRYDRVPGPAFMTLYQDSPLLSKFVPLLTHVRITRITPSTNTECYNGIYVDPSSSGDDVVLSCIDYLGLLGVSRSGFRTLYPNKLIGTEIVQPEWGLVDVAGSPLQFYSQGTIEDPLGTDGTTPIKTNAGFGTLDQMRLQLFYDLTEIGRANTVNHVTFELSRTSPWLFTFLKNKGSVVGMGLVLGGNVSDYQYVPGWRRYRNDLATVGGSLSGGAAEIVKTDSAEITARGRRQDVFAIRTLLGISGAATEADQQQAVTERALKRALQPLDALALRLMPGLVEPFSGWDICDKAPVEIGNGIDSITGNRRIVGYREVITEAGEHPVMFVEPILT